MSHEQDIQASEREFEQTLVSLTQRGDRSAFNRLVERHQAGAYALALRMVGDPDIAADVTQDSFFSAYRSIGSFHGSSFRAWLYRIVGNASIDHFRSRTRHPQVSLDAVLESGQDADSVGSARVPESMIDPTWDPETLVLRAETVERIQSALLDLPAEQRLALVLCDIQGLAYEEIARVMDTSLGTVKSRIARGRDHMRQALLRQGELSRSQRRPGSGTSSPQL